MTRTTQVGSSEFPSFRGVPVADMIRNTRLSFLSRILETNIGTQSRTDSRSRRARASSEDLRDALDGVYLTRLETAVSSRGHRKVYTYDLGLDADEPTALLLRNPRDTLMSFGGHRDPSSAAMVASVWHVAAVGDASRIKRGSPSSDAASAPDRSGDPLGTPAGRKLGPVDVVRGAESVFAPPPSEVTKDRPEPTGRYTVPSDLSLRVFVDQDQRVLEAQLFGKSVQFHLSPGLVRPVATADPDTTAQGPQPRVSTFLEDRVITLSPRTVPRLSRPLAFDGQIVVLPLRGHAIRLRLHTAEFGGSGRKPRLVFPDAEVV